MEIKMGIGEQFEFEKTGRIDPEPTYRILEFNEIIQEGDEVDMCDDPWRESPLWKPTIFIGGRVPDPRFPAHRIYRRRIQ